MSGIECQEVLRELEVYLDGELPPEESDRVAAHLAECGPCFQRQEFLASLRRIVREKCGRVERLPEGLSQRVRRSIAEDG